MGPRRVSSSARPALPLAGRGTWGRTDGGAGLLDRFCKVEFETMSEMTMPSMERLTCSALLRMFTMDKSFYREVRGNTRRSIATSVFDAAVLICLQCALLRREDYPRSQASHGQQMVGEAVDAVETVGVTQIPFGARDMVLSGFIAADQRPPYRPVPSSVDNLGTVVRAVDTKHARACLGLR